jgi:hypothetical protein
MVSAVGQAIDNKQTNQKKKNQTTKKIATTKGNNDFHTNKFPRLD